MLTPENLVKNEIVYCVSALVSEFAANETTHDDDLYHILGGYEECQECDGEGCNECDDGEALVEVLEHWIVSDWLGRELEKQGERVAFDFHGLTVWGRQTSGQGIAMDYVIEKISKAK